MAIHRQLVFALRNILALNFNSLFSQYALTAAGVGGGTGYALYKRPKNGIALMIFAGAAGSLADLAYGWTTACRPQVEAWQEQQQQLRKESLRRSRD